MLILSCSSKLRLLEGMLRRGLPQTLPVYGSVMYVNRGNPAGNEVLVDSWPDFKIVLTRPRREVACDLSDHFTNLYSVFYQEEGAFRSLLEKSQAMDWSQAFQISGMQDGLYEAIRDFARDRGVDVDVNRYQTLLHPDPSAMPQHRLDKGLTLAPVSPTHAGLLKKTWVLRKYSWSLRYLDFLIRNFPSACLLDPQGHPISWTLTDNQAHLTHGYTLPGHRGKGYVGTVLMALATQLHPRGFPLYAGVLPENESSLRTLHHHGFHTQPGLFYSLIVTPRPTQTQPVTALDSAQGPAPSSGG
uniref:Glycine N-acyltransferase-like protein n=1 Tax=Pelusios castaneus TaxID=367368 RepID=A0A8C8VP99_9SAUR